LALCDAPYRTFLNYSSSSSSSNNKKNLLLYCLPTSVSEYVAFSSEATTVRSQIFNTATTATTDTATTIVAIYSVEQDDFLGGTMEDLLLAMSSNNNNNNDQQLLLQNQFSQAALLALAELDGKAAQQLLGTTNNNNKDVVIVVGSGGREHALAVAIAKSPLVGRVVCCPGNGGTAVEGGKISNAPNGNEDNATVITLVQQTGANMVVVGPEAPLVAGLVDELAVLYPKVLVFGPTKAAAELEASKVSKEWSGVHDTKCDHGMC
jgi:Phosphoribosylglycinamide synthetase, N domain